MCIRARIEGTLEKQQNKLQKGFTNIALLITESINGAKDNNETLILITLDTEKTFDVVDHFLVHRTFAIISKLSVDLFH
jgi:hypothetical protein